TVTAELSSSPINAVIAVSQYANANVNEPVGNTAGANSNGVNGSCSGGSDTETYSFDLTVSANNLVYEAFAPRLREHESTSGFTEVSQVYEGSGGDVAGLVLLEEPVTTTASQTVSGVLNSDTDWAAAAIEIKGGDSISGVPGDANGDEKVDGKDFTIWLNNYGSTTSNGASDGDFNGDEKVDGKDFTIWLNNYGTVAPTATATSAPSATNTPQPDEPTNTPEPSDTPTPTNTPNPTATDGPTPTLPPIGSSDGIWISPEEIKQLPTSGSAWQNVLSEANSSWGSACLDDNDCQHDVKTLAGALVSVRLDDSSMRQKTINGLQSAMSSDLYRSLELSRGLQSYVVAADVIGYRTSAFERWVKSMLEADVRPHNGGSSLCNPWGQSYDCSGVGGIVCTAFRSANNWGGHARASVVASLLYLRSSSDSEVSNFANELLPTAVNTHRAFNGEGVTNHLYCKDTNWHADPDNKAGINRLGATIQGVNVSGVAPEDWRRAQEFQWPPAETGYMWGALQGHSVAAGMLHRAGLVPFDSGDRAILRAMDILYGMNEAGYGEALENDPVYTNFAEGDDTWIPWVINYFAGTNYPTDPADEGKGMGYTDWT
ncbi:MAG TPA: dockerin type I domain-containing protein, partial [Bacteroidales bacterium]|nr:dockerin type I domain-containing protein [Bacteroidales bacterium]